MGEDENMERKDRNDLSLPAQQQQQAKINREQSLQLRRRLRNEMVSFITKNKGIVNAMIHSSTHDVLSPSQSFSLMVSDYRCRTLLTFENKRKYFLDTLRKPHQHGLGEIPVSVRRSHILEDSFHALSDKPTSELFGPLNINFVGEEGVDAGGLTRDWFLQLFRTLLNPMYGLFEFSSDGSTYQPATATALDNHSLNLKYFQFAGRMIGKAIFDGQLVDAHFTRSFYKHMLGIPVTPNDMEAIDPQFYKSLRQGRNLFRNLFIGTPFLFIFFLI